MLQFLIFGSQFISNDIAINVLSEKLLLQDCGEILVISSFSFAVMCLYHLGKIYVFAETPKEM